MDHEKYRLILKKLGIERVREVEEIAGDEPVYFRAVIHEWQLLVIENGMNEKKSVKELAELSGMSERSIYRKYEEKREAVRSKNK